MSAELHTPGPWRWFNYPGGRKMLVAPNRAVIHCPDAAMGCDREDQLLIAAAPQLLAALKALVASVAEHEEDMAGTGHACADAAAVAAARAAIALAEPT